MNGVQKHSRKCRKMTVIIGMIDVINYVVDMLALKKIEMIGVIGLTTQDSSCWSTKTTLLILTAMVHAKDGIWMVKHSIDLERQQRICFVLEYRHFQINYNNNINKKHKT
jgi:uncharacterized membrane protein